MTTLGKTWKWSEKSKLKLKERIFSPIHCKRISEAKKIQYKGEGNPFYGKHHSIETKRIISAANSGANNKHWKGDNPGYCAVHVWVKARLPRPDTCFNCDQTSNLELSNISGNYLRDVDDWQWLCPSCHNAFDELFGSKKRDRETGLYMKSTVQKRIRSFKT